MCSSDLIAPGPLRRKTPRAEVPAAVAEARIVPSSTAWPPVYPWNRPQRFLRRFFFFFAEEDTTLCSADLFFAG